MLAAALALLQQYFTYVVVFVLTVFFLLRKSAKDGKIHHEKKQGGYGKIPVFQKKISFGALLLNPKALVAIVKLKTGVGLPGVKKGKIPAPPDFKVSDDDAKFIDEDIIFCGTMLDKVSRSFASVIRQLPVTLALPVCIFYLILRALDTVEDDMDLQKFKAALASAEGGKRRPAAISDDEAREFKFKCLTHFHTLLEPEESDFYNDKVIFKTLSDADVGEKDEATLFKKFDSVVRVYNSCAKAQRDIMVDITKQMAAGMADYIGRDLSDKGTEDLADYGQYCHYVAGLVGEGLSRLWTTASDSGLPQKTLDQLSSERGLDTLSSDMGLFLQKTNIIRDYLEDILDQRAFWPKEVWGQYVKNLGDLKEEEFLAEALACLNHMICDALEKVPSSLTYLGLLEDGSNQVMRFCAIPQAMAIATLEKLYANPLVFKGVVKIWKPTAARIVVETGSMAGIKAWFLACTKELQSKTKAWQKSKYFLPEKSAAVAKRTVELLSQVEALCR